MKRLHESENNEPFDDIFANPPARYRDTPFWAWNCKLDKDQLFRQIETFRQMGMGGFHMHARTGLDTPYLGPEFMERVKDCVARAKQKQMLGCLYDEDRWPSGAAGGLVTGDPKYRARYLHVQSEARQEAPDTANDNSGKFLAAYSIFLDERGKLAEYRRIAGDEAVPQNRRKIYCYRMVRKGDPWFNHQAYVDTLNAAAIREFIDITYEAYFKTVGNEFGKTIPSIFTDEPQFTRKSVLKFAQAEKVEADLPYTDDFPESYRETYRCDFFDTLPELLWELPEGGCSVARYRYHDHVSARFVAAFPDQIGNWCEAHHIRFSGHLLEESPLAAQTMAVGDAMRCYRSFQLPGIDILCDRREFTTAKQAQSVSRQFGRGGMISELDGVTDWDFTFAGHKGQGDWQAALGVTVRVPHLAWASMAGEAKRDYPASIGGQSPWWKKYPLIANHFARVGVAMTRGVPVCKVGVIHTIESFWLLYGPLDQTATARSQAEQDFLTLPEWLIGGLIDFDYISESLLPEQGGGTEGKKFRVGEMAYSTVVIPPTITLRSSTLARLEAFADAGGRVLFAGDVATLCDAVPSERAAKLAARCERIKFTRGALLSALESEREFSVIRGDNGYPAEHLVGQLRQDGDVRYLFLANSLRVGDAYAAQLRLNGSWQLDLPDTESGEITLLAARREREQTVLDFDMHPHGHLLLRLRPASQSRGEAMPRTPITGPEEEAAILERLCVSEMAAELDEPNVLVLDRAEWRVNGGAWQPQMEILRVDSRVRTMFGLPSKMGGHMAQPWTAVKTKRKYGELELRYSIDDAIALDGLRLALEQPEGTRIFLDGIPVPFSDCGCWTDECVRTTRFPALAPGKHELRLRREYRDETNVERLFLLGDFGVELAGTEATLTSPVRALHFGSVTEQGLPFYSGNVTYLLPFERQTAEHCAVRFPSRRKMAEQSWPTFAARECEFAGFAGVLLDVKLDGIPMGDVAFAPYELDLGMVSPGKHELAVTVYGSRANSFGALHLAGRIWWTGPYTWREEGNLFREDYRPFPFGLLRPPHLVSRV